MERLSNRRTNWRESRSDSFAGSSRRSSSAGDPRATKPEFSVYLIAFMTSPELGHAAVGSVLGGSPDLRPTTQTARHRRRQARLLRGSLDRRVRAVMGHKFQVLSTARIALSDNRIPTSAIDYRIWASISTVAVSISSRFNPSGPSVTACP
jgi:hypothetical protein